MDALSLFTEPVDYGFVEFDLVFLEAPNMWKDLVVSWESLNRSVIIDLGSQRP